MSSYLTLVGGSAMDTLLRRATLPLIFGSRPSRNFRGQLMPKPKPRAMKPSVEQPVPGRQPKLYFLIIEWLGMSAHLSDNMRQSITKLRSTWPIFINVAVDLLSFRRLFHNTCHEQHPCPGGQQQVDHSCVRHVFWGDSAEVIQEVLKRSAFKHGFSHLRSSRVDRHRPEAACDHAIKLGGVDKYQFGPCDTFSLRGPCGTAGSPKCGDNSRKRHQRRYSLPVHNFGNVRNWLSKPKKPTNQISPHSTHPSSALIRFTYRRSFSPRRCAFGGLI